MAQLANRRSIMSLYSDAVESSSHAVRFVLSEKAINVEIHNTTAENKPEDLIDLNPYGGILTLVDRELVLYEAQIIMEYLDERFPHPPLMPVDPVNRASSRLYRYRINRDIYSLLPEIEQGSVRKSDAAKKKLKDQLTSIAPIFKQTEFFMANDYSLVDCYLAPILWRLPHYGIELPARARSIEQYASRLFEREAFDASLTDKEREFRSA